MKIGNGGMDMDWELDENGCVVKLTAILHLFIYLLEHCICLFSKKVPIIRIGKLNFIPK